MFPYQTTSQLILSKIKSATKILVVCHNNPDGDALGSLTAVGCLLANLNKDYCLFCVDMPSERWNFLPQIDKIVSDQTKLNLASFDLIITLDCGSLARTGLAEAITNRLPSQIFIDIDHHLATNSLAEVELRDPAAASTTEILYWLCRANDLAWSADLATALLTGMLTDTANFFHPNSSSRVMEAAGDLLVRGARLSVIVRQTSQRQSVGALRLWGLAMSRLTVNARHNLAFVGLTAEDLAGQTEEDLEGIAGFLNNLPSVRGLLFLRDWGDGQVKISVRSNDDSFNAADFAKTLGGGGHARAAGCVVAGRLVLTDGKWNIVD